MFQRYASTITMKSTLHATGFGRCTTSSESGWKADTAGLKHMVSAYLIDQTWNPFRIIIRILLVLVQSSTPSPLWFLHVLTQIATRNPPYCDSQTRFYSSDFAWIRFWCFHEQKYTSPSRIEFLDWYFWWSIYRYCCLILFLFFSNCFWFCTRIQQHLLV